MGTTLFHLLLNVNGGNLEHAIGKAPSCNIQTPCDTKLKSLDMPLGSFPVATSKHLEINSIKLGHAIGKFPSCNIQTP